MRVLLIIPPVVATIAIVSSAQAELSAEAAVRSGIQFPMGSATGTASDDLSDTFGAQLPLFLDVGVLPLPRLFVGAYGGIGIGGAGGNTSESCDRADATCIGRTVRTGAEVHWHFRNRNITHAWVGYGFGYEWARMLMSTDAGTQVVSFRGPEYAHLLFGIDFESKRDDLARIGIFLDYSMASYRNMKVKSWTSPAVEIPSFETSTHGWLMVGLRGVVLP